MNQHPAKIAEYKKKIVVKMVELIRKYPVIGIVNMESLPAPQLQKLRSGLRGTLNIVMTKKTLMKIALENVKSEKKGIDALANYFEGMPAFVFTDQNPFKVSSILQKNKSSAPAKANQVAPEDIIVPAGPTPFAPGPIISDLGMAGIKSGVEGGKIVVKSDCVVAKKGERIKPKVADVLARLGIQPMEIGLELIAAYDKGTIYEKGILSVTQDEYISRIVKASCEAKALALEVSYVTKETVTYLIIEAFVSAKALAESQGMPPEEVRKEERISEEKKEAKQEEKIREVRKEVKEKARKEEVMIKELEQKPKLEEAEEPKQELQKQMPLKEKEEEEVKEIKEEREEKEIEKGEAVLKKPRMVADAVSQEKAGQLLDQLKKEGSFRRPIIEKKAEKKDVSHIDLSKEKIEDLAKQLSRKGTLRGKGGK